MATLPKNVTAAEVANMHPVLQLYYNAQQVGNLLGSAGVPSYLLPYVVAAVMHETNGLTSKVARTDNNYSGIAFVRQPGATPGLPYPGSEGNYHYAHFTTPWNWALDYYRILSIKGPKGAPIDAGNVNDFVSRLKANRYFTANESVYLGGVKDWYNKIMDSMKNGWKYYQDPNKKQKAANTVQIPGTNKQSALQPPPAAPGAQSPGNAAVQASGSPAGGSPGQGAHHSLLDWFKEGGSDWGTGTGYNWLRVGGAVIAGIVLIKLVSK